VPEALLTAVDEVGHDSGATMGGFAERVAPR
jgi:hypothetical protein